jgi:DNA topoisomerase-1
MDLGIVTEAKEINKNILEAYDAAAQALGNTRNVCRKYYVHPLLVSAYEDGSLQRSFNYVESHTEGELYFSPSEKAILRLISNYRPDISNA